MCAYFSKVEDETSEAMKQATQKASVSGKSNFERMRAVARAYSTKRECSVQESVYLVLPELWLRKTFPKVIFLNSNILKKRYRIFPRKEDLDKLPDDSTDVFQRNILDRCLDRQTKSFRMVNLQYLIQSVLPSFYPFNISSQSQNQNYIVIVSQLY